jgi:ADP-ribose pyrophosphatase YjhB (NUDIX family)
MATAIRSDDDGWYAGLPAVVIAAGALITDQAGRPLLVKPNYRDHWGLPGGVCEHGEPPHVGCAREVTEELGLAIEVGRLLALDWMQLYGRQARASMHFVFDGGVLADDRGIVLQREELDDFAFTAVADLPRFLPPHSLPRVTGALRALETGTVSYEPWFPDSPE